MNAAARQSPGSLVANLKIGARTTNVIRKTIAATIARRTVMRATGPAVSGRMRSSSPRIQSRTGSRNPVRRRTATSASLRRPLAEQALGREGDQAELESLVVPDVGHIQRVEEAGRAGQRAGDQEGERDRPVDVDAHH